MSPLGGWRHRQGRPCLAAAGGRRSQVTQGWRRRSPPGVSPRTHSASFQRGRGARPCWPASLSDRL